MKDVGDKMRKCPKDVCRVKNYDLTMVKVLDGNFVALVVSIVGFIYY